MFQIIKKEGIRQIIKSAESPYFKRFSHIFLKPIVSKCGFTYHEKNNPWNSYQDIYQEYASHPHSERSLLCKATLIGLIAHFDLEGIYPGKHQWHALWGRGVYTQLVPEFKGLADHYRNLADTLRICENTVKSNLSAISNFLFFSKSWMSFT